MSQKGQEPPGMLLDRSSSAWLSRASLIRQILYWTSFLPVSIGGLADKQPSPVPNRTLHPSQIFPLAFVYPLGIRLSSHLTTFTEREFFPRHRGGTRNTKIYRTWTLRSSNSAWMELVDDTPALAAPGSLPLETMPILQDSAPRPPFRVFSSETTIPPCSLK